ncbi:hypothetical protein BTW00_04550 [Psychrobacter sp. C 20.9]|nr:hypothetical protein BTW00_04550 [Psychrobacter sp. C 20.9]
MSIQIMAESIVLHFANTEIDKVEKAFMEFSEVIGNTYYVPSKNGYLIQIYPYEGYLKEYDSSEKLEVASHLGSEPEFSFCVEIRRLYQNEAFNITKILIMVKLEGFNFVVDDNSDKIWTKMEIMNNQNSFLSKYSH